MAEVVSAAEGTRPALLLDVDGVLRVFADRKPERYITDPDCPLFAYNPDIRRWLKGVLDKTEAYYISDWRDNCHQEIGALLLLPELDWVNDDPYRRHAYTASSRALAIAALFGERPVAWIDDEITTADYQWAEMRDAPTLLVKTDEEHGIQSHDIAQINEWLANLKIA